LPASWTKLALAVMSKRGICRLIISAAIFLAASSGTLATFCQTGAPAWRNAVDRAARETPQARIIVLDIASGRLLATNRLDDAARTLAAPGSTLKPLVLYGLVSASRWDPASRVACNRQLVVAGHRLACTHPLAPPFNAREALTWSCNSYFAAVARTLRTGELGQLLRPSGLLGPTGLVGLSGVAHDEAVAEFREPETVDAEQLALLGVEGVRVTPLELAAAYRWLAREIAAHPDSDASQVVRAGLEDSASFGMAGQASLGGVAAMGKTGTAEGAASNRSHGWFAGIAPAANPKIVVVVYLPAGRGADAAHVAGEILTYAPLERP
jgi:cell division protein FtsI/penicillin-binding protein 2